LIDIGRDEAEFLSVVDVKVFLASTSLASAGLHGTRLNGLALAELRNFQNALGGVAERF
jgi:hypothetical protein